MKAEAEGTVIATNGDRKLTFSPSAEGGVWAVCRGGKGARSRRLSKRSAR